jgi:hypothetical protein
LPNTDCSGPGRRVHPPERDRRGTETPTGTNDQRNDWPAPVEILGATGSVQYQIREGKTITVPILVTGYDAGIRSKKQREQRRRHIWITSAPARPSSAGWTDAQPHIGTPEKSDKQLWDGTVFTYDGNNLANGATVQIYFWGANVATDPRSFSGSRRRSRAQRLRSVL